MTQIFVNKYLFMANERKQNLLLPSWKMEDITLKKPRWTTIVSFKTRTILKPTLSCTDVESADVKCQNIVYINNKEQRKNTRSMWVCFSLFFVVNTKCNKNIGERSSPNTKKMSKYLAHVQHGLTSLLRSVQRLIDRRLIWLSRYWFGQVPLA